MRISDFVQTWSQSPFRDCDGAPWTATIQADALIAAAQVRLSVDYVELAPQIFRHASAVIEDGAIVKAPAILGPNTFVAANAYLRNGTFLDDGCIVGPSCELRATFMFAGSKVAHLSFVGDSIIGAGANVEAGAMIANYRNEMDDKEIRIKTASGVLRTGVDKFGALIGDGVRIGAGAVIAPGALIAAGTRVPRLARIDQHPEPLIE